jgi:selenoprotein W-related protein
LAADIKKQTGVDAELIKGSGGVFEVVVDSKLIYSKKETGRFPDHHEVLSQLSS